MAFNEVFAHLYLFLVVIVCVCVCVCVCVGGGVMSPSFSLTLPSFLFPPRFLPLLPSLSLFFCYVYITCLTAHSPAKSKVRPLYPK